MSNISKIYNNSIFWVDVEKVSPNPFQPRSEFDTSKLESLADSIRQYGILQPLVVTRKEEPKEDGGLLISYELIVGERRLRASRLAGISQVPVIIREADSDDDQLKLELAIIENIQREDLNPIDRARAFKQLIETFGFKHGQVAVKVGKSREYISNTIRLLTLPEEIILALIEKRITEGHARPLMMLVDKPEEQVTLFKEIMLKKLTVREAERIAHHVAQEKVRKRSEYFDPDLIAIEERLTTDLGTRVQIERRHIGGKITIDFLSSEDLENILDRLESKKEEKRGIADEPFIEHIPKEERLEGMEDRRIEEDHKVETSNKPALPEREKIPPHGVESSSAESSSAEASDSVSLANEKTHSKSDETSPSDEEDLYSVKNFSI